MKKALVIGAAGFVGNYLIDCMLKSKGWSVAATKMKNEMYSHTNVEMFDLDISEEQDVLDLLKTVHPDYILHLAAQSSVALSWSKPDLTVDVNIKGALHVLDAIRKLDYKPRILLIGSGEEYGRVKPEQIPIDESEKPNPGNLYAMTKVCQNMMGKIYAEAYDMDIMSVRAFNHIGPSQLPRFAVANFCKQIAEIEKGIKEPVVYVGNLSARRDFTDVRDVVRAYCELVENGKAGETYNVGSGQAVSLQAVLDIILSMSKAKVKIEIDRERIRPVDVPIIEADIRKMVECTGWKKEIPLEQTLQETLEYWRNKV